ncbi:MAG: RNA-binding protein [Planctomycetes bacterium]|nr:RNA-binding protein [Planctomycetota bacterium]
MDIYIGNLSPETSEDELRKLFEPYGKVKSINIMKDTFSGRPLGFGFVKMSKSKEAQEAISILNRTRIKKNVVMISETEDTPERRTTGRG